MKKFSGFWWLQSCYVIAMGFIIIKAIIIEGDTSWQVWIAMLCFTIPYAIVMIYNYRKQRKNANRRHISR